MKYTVIKELVSFYAVEVEAEDATDAVIKARNNEHSDGDLVNDDSQNETQWQVFEGDLDYPIDDSKALPTNAARIIADMTPKHPIDLSTCPWCGSDMTERMSKRVVHCTTCNKDYDAPVEDYT